jgi:hypothetical protein
MLCIVCFAPLLSRDAELTAGRGSLCARECGLRSLRRREYSGLFSGMRSGKVKGVQKCADYVVCCVLRRLARKLGGHECKHRKHRDGSAEGFAGMPGSC